MIASMKRAMSAVGGSVRLELHIMVLGDQYSKVGITSIHNEIFLDIVLTSSRSVCS